MKTTTKRTLTLLATVAILSSLIFTSNRNPSSTLSTTRLNDENLTNIPPQQIPIYQNNNSSPDLPLAGIKTFGQLQRKLTLNQDEPSRLRYLSVAAAVCEGHREAHSTSYGSILLRTASGRYYARRADRFCSDFTASQEEFELALIAHEDSDVVQARDLLDPEADGVDPATQQLGEKIVLTSNNAMAIYDAAAVLTGGGTWSLGQELAVTKEQQDALSHAQWIAARLLACDISGGCGPDGLTTLIECGGSNLCAPGVTVRSVLAWESSPVTFELAEQIHAQLRAMRANADH